MSPAVLFFFGLLFSSAVPGQEPLTTVKGIVVDWQYARVLRTTVVFESATHRREIEADDEGAYEVELPKGEYAVKATFPGFQQRKVKLELESSSPRILNLMLDVEITKPIKCPKGFACL